MSETHLPDGDVIVRAQGGSADHAQPPGGDQRADARHEPRDDRGARSWRADHAVGRVLDGAGERGLCAGGDIRALYDAARRRNDLPGGSGERISLDVGISRYPKPSSRSWTAS